MSPPGGRTLGALSAHRWLRRASYRGPFRPLAQRGLKALLPATLAPAERRGIAEVMGWLLSEPQAPCRNILREFLFHRAVFAKRWADVMARRVHVADVVSAVRVDHEDALRDFLHTETRGLVVTTYHAGDYLAALLKLTTLLPAGRTIHVLRPADGQTRDANRVLPALLPNIRVVRDDGPGARSAIRALRRGQLLAVLCDLPDTWGAGAPLTLFGRGAVWTKSAVDLAILGQADLLPLSSRLTRHGCCIATPHPVLPAGRFETLATMQHLGRLGERLIRSVPGQWHQWPLVPAMCENPTPRARADD